MTLKYIAYIDGNIERAASIGPAYTPAQAALAMGLEDGAWREINAEEAAALQAPTAEDLRQQRLAEIDARLAEIDAESIRPLRAVADGSAGDFDRQKLAELEAEAAALRAERAEMTAPV